MAQRFRRFYRPPLQRGVPLTPPAPAPAVAAPDEDQERRCKRCNAPLGWRDAAYGRQGCCKRCTQQTARQQSRGTFIPANVYGQVLHARRQAPATAAQKPAE